MRAIFGVLSLLIVVAIVGMLAKKQLGAGVAPRTPASESGAAAVPAANPRQQVQQFQQAVESAVQQPRAMPDDSK